MILVAEGPSAAGKTTWLSHHDQELVIAERGRVEPRQEPPDVEARFWIDVNADRWRHAVTVEATHGSALCDTDPLKLHYDYCRARAGVAAWSLFEAGVKACGAAIAEHRLGIADLILCEIPDVDTLEARRRRDATRTRRNFALHRDFGPALREWYATLDTLDPGRVAWAFPATVPRADVRDRYDVTLFNTWMSELPSRPRLSEFRVR